MVFQHGLSQPAKLVAACIVSAISVMLPGCGGDNGGEFGTSGGQSTAGGSSTTGGQAASSGGAAETTGGQVASSGGSANVAGGAPSETGGTATGGTATGGTATGGTATGGTATGGTATGGTATGGAATGGTSNCIPAATPGPSGMNAGQACLGCHATSVQPNLRLAGTLYSAATGGNPVSGATVTVLDSNNAVTTLVTASSGNFYSTANFAFPVSVSVSKCPDAASMSSKPSTGDCNSCHGSSMRIHLP